MKSIQKTSILLIIMFISHSFYMIAFPSRSGGGSSRGSSTAARGSSSNRSSATARSAGFNRGDGNTASPKALAGGASIRNNNQQHQKAGAAGMVAMASANQSAEDSEYSEPTESSEAPQDQTQAPIYQNMEEQPQQQYSSMPMDNFGEPMHNSFDSRQEQGQPFNENFQQQSPQEEAPQDNLEQDNIAEKAELSPAELIAHDKKTIAPDKDEILKKLKMIEQIDSKTNILLSEKSLDQLFNNFVYFKNFIVTNFSKDKMLSLCTELINQIYPKEVTPIITMTPEKIEMASNNKKESKDSQEKKVAVENTLQEKAETINSLTEYSDSDSDEKLDEEESSDEVIN